MSAAKNGNKKKKTPAQRRAEGEASDALVGGLEEAKKEELASYKREEMVLQEKTI